MTAHKLWANSQVSIFSQSALRPCTCPCEGEGVFLPEALLGPLQRKPVEPIVVEVDHEGPPEQWPV